MDRDLFLIGLTLAAAADLQTRRIPNSLTYSLVAYGLLGAGLRSCGFGLPSLLVTTPPIALGDAMCGFLSCTAVMLVGWLLFGMGGADVKLSAAIGASLGADLGLAAIAIAYLLAGVLVIGVLLARSRWGRTAAICLTFFGGDGLRGQFSERFSAGLKSEIPMAPFFALGTCYALLLGAL